MNGSEITIFYSWQSDLPGSETRNLIQDSIKNAVKLLRDTVDVEADRDTQGEFGSPDIAQTIFTKIDNCDIFIADVTAVCKFQSVDKDGHPNGKLKLMPNPNVMLELGYATQVVGWENVICILNSDYGSFDDMPFDIANRRLTPYSLKDGKSKGDVRRYLRAIIQETVENILENGQRVKSGFSNLRIGCFDSGNICDGLIPYVITKSTKFIEHKAALVAESIELVKAIRDIHLPEISRNTQLEEAKNVVESKTIILKDGSVLKPISPLLSLDLFKSHTAIVKEEDKATITELCKQYLGEDISNESDFFIIGELKQKYEIGISPSYEYEGSSEEKEKYDKLMLLEYRLHQLSMWDWYATTFDELLFVPLGIENMSTIADEDIDIYISTNTETVDVLIPSEELINPEMKGLEGLVVEEDIIKKLLLMNESSLIQYDTDISSCLEDTQAAIRAQFSAASINGNPRFNCEDYKREISKYIAMPIDGSRSEFSFHINSLRAYEKKWLGPALLFRPLT